MNRRGFFGALAALPAAVKAAPAAAKMDHVEAVVQVCRRFSKPLAGMQAWIPETPPTAGDGFFGIARVPYDPARIWIEWRDQNGIVHRMRQYTDADLARFVPGPETARAL